MVPTLLSVIFILTTAPVVHCKSSREEAFSRINHYELIRINLTLFVSQQIIEFHSFDHHYIIQLVPNHNLVASHIRHTTFDPTASPKRFITSLTRSCHYFGSVRNAPSGSTVALSLCDHRGVRGHITAFDETIYIKPAAYYLDFAASASLGHNLTDQVLVYRLSDFNTTNIGRASAIDGHPNRAQNQLMKTVDNKRRRLYSIRNPAETEILVVNGPLRTLRYQNSYGSSWYEQLVADLLDVFNDVSALYESANWGSVVGGTGSVTVKLVELEVIFAFTGRHAMLAPNYYYSNCQTSYANCNINGRDWLGKFRTWVAVYKDVSTFDNAQLIGDMEFSPQTSGWGNIAVVCRGSASVSDIYEGWGLDKMVRTIAHELGHNFGMAHDGVTGEGLSCSVNSGLMGYGSNDVEFSSCSIASFQSYFLEQDGLTCLTASDREFTSNYDDDDGGNLDPTPEPTVRPTPRPTTRPPVTTPTTSTTSRPTTSTTSGSSGDTWDCLGMQNVANANFNGYWQNVDTNDGKAVYGLNGFYLYYYAAYAWWLISTEIGGLVDLKGYCRGTQDIADCSGSLNVFASGGWLEESSSSFYDCSDSGNTDSDSDGDSNIDLVCTYYETLTIVGMTTDKYGRSYDGVWLPSGCHNGESYYLKSGDSSRYLCKSSDFNFWIISDELCGKTAFAYSQATGGLMSTQNNWYVLGATGWASDTYVLLSAGGSFTNEDLSCLEYNEYDTLCIYSNDSLWNGERTFALNKKLCRNDQPLYQHIDYYEDEEQDAFGNVNDGIEAIYHLFYHEELRYSDGNETIGQWMISKDEISLDAIAVCEKEDVLQCTEGYWIVDDYSLNEHANFDGLLKKVVDVYMTINENECESTQEGPSGDKDAVNLDLLIYIIGAIVVVIAICVCSVWCYRQKKLIPKQLDMIRSYESDEEEEQRVDVGSGDERHSHHQHDDIEAAGLTSTMTR